MQIGYRPERALDAEVADALEHRGRHRVRQRQPPDHQAQGADAQEQRREERRRLLEEPAHLAGNRDVDARHGFLDAARDGVGILPGPPGNRGPGVQIPAPEPACPEELDEERIAAQPEVARILDRHHRKPVGRRQRLVEHADDRPRKAGHLEATPDAELSRGGEIGSQHRDAAVARLEKAAGRTGSSRSSG